MTLPTTPIRQIVTSIISTPPTPLSVPPSLSSAITDCCRVHDDDVDVGDDIDPYVRLAALSSGDGTMV